MKRSRRWLTGMLFIPFLIHPSCCLTPQLGEAIADTIDSDLPADGNPLTTTGVVVGRTGLVALEVVLLPVAIAADILIVPPVTIVWIVLTAGGHGSPPFGCR